MKKTLIIIIMVMFLFAGSAKAVSISELINIFNQIKIQLDLAMNQLAEIKGTEVVEDVSFPVKILNPNGGEELKPGDKYEIKWISEDYSSLASVSISLIDTTYSESDAKGMQVIVNQLNSGSYKWTVPSIVRGMDMFESETVYKLKIEIEEDGKDKTSDYSDSFFTVLLKDDCHFYDIGNYLYCTPTCKCVNGEGGCRYDSDCDTGYCRKGIGGNYGWSSSVNVCEYRESNYCLDNDEGKDFTEKARTWDQSGFSFDYCQDNNTLVEYSCNSNNLRESYLYNCTNGCKSGRCLTK